MSAFPGDLTCDGPSSQWPAAPDQSMKTALSSSRLSAAPHGAWASAPAPCGHTALLPSSGRPCCLPAPLTGRGPGVLSATCPCRHLLTALPGAPAQTGGLNPRKGCSRHWLRDLGEVSKTLQVGGGARGQRQNHHRGQVPVGKPGSDESLGPALRGAGCPAQLLWTKPACRKRGLLLQTAEPCSCSSQSQGLSLPDLRCPSPLFHTPSSAVLPLVWGTRWCGRGQEPPPSPSEPFPVPFCAH